jgi:hypothetical protein
MLCCAASTEARGGRGGREWCQRDRGCDRECSRSRECRQAASGVRSPIRCRRKKIKVKEGEPYSYGIVSSVLPLPYLCWAQI